ncbi:FAD:protein FMN transferase [bacterium]|nr:FAD:protein FMN transferase [bacterium]
MVGETQASQGNSWISGFQAFSTDHCRFCRFESKPAGFRYGSGRFWCTRQEAASYIGEAGLMPTGTRELVDQSMPTETLSTQNAAITLQAKFDSCSALRRRHLNIALILLAAAIFYLFSPPSALAQDSPERSKGKIAEFVGPTMGTRFMVKIYDPPEFELDVRLEVDALLRHINDLMSTYLPQSEISRFNDSASLDWFAASEETVGVIAFAQNLAVKTNGAFDITVQPLVNAWSFGPKERTRTLPTKDELNSIREFIGYEKLEYRIDPPAIRKSHPQLEIDLSSIAKGYAVDQIVELLNGMGASNVFVEIGGEVRTSGDKNGEPWQVGIQVPDALEENVLIAQPLNTKPNNDQAMATSGDYRNFFEKDGVRYSHTIDPRTTMPIEHDMASISVIAPTCMVADAWATALNVVGFEASQALVENEGLSTLAVQRQSNGYSYHGSQLLAEHAVSLTMALTATSPAETSPAAQATDTKDPGSNSSILVIVLSACTFGLIVAGMAVGVMFGRRAISGSCGGIANTQDADGNTSCALCSSPSDACKELREKMNQDDAPTPVDKAEE